MDIKTTLSQDISTQERILLAARELMWINGFSGTTTKMIAEKAGVNEVTIFRTFKNKQNILKEMINYLEKNNLSPIDEFLEQDFKNLEELLDKLIFLFLDKFIKVKDVFLLCLKEAGRDNSEVSKIVIRIMFLDSKRVANRIAKIIPDINLTEAELDTAAFMFINTLITSSVLQLIMGGENLQFNLEDISQRAKKILLNALR
jgi:AcrR family transcriptional regulator